MISTTKGTNINTRNNRSAKSRSKQALRLWLRLLKCESAVEQKLRANLKKHFNTSLAQFDALAELTYLDRPQTMTELSNSLMVSNGNVTGIVDRLVRDGFAERTPSESDRRVNFIKVTDKGIKAFDAMAIAHEQWINEAFSDLSLQELSQLSSTLKRIDTTSM